MSVSPTADDPWVRSVSESVGGPIGTRAGRHRWWTPMRVILALTALSFALGMVQKTPCVKADWLDSDVNYGSMCYSDLPYLYTYRGFAETHWPYDDNEQLRERYEAMEYPVGISYYVWGTAWLTHWAAGSPDISDRRVQDPGRLFATPQLQRETHWFYLINALLLGLMTLLASALLVKVNPGRPWDAAGFALAPALVTTGLINWDLTAVVLVAAALWAWAADRPVLTGLAIGVGTATKLFPLFLLGGVLIICWRRRQWGEFLLCAGAALVAWVLTNAPAFLTGPQTWRHFWSFNSERAADLGSVWLVIAQAGQVAISAELINRVSLAFFIAWCTGVLVLGMLARETPRLAQLGFLIVAGFLLVNKVYSPQYVLWLLPLAVLARPRWRDLLIWQAGEVFYFAAVWWYLGGALERSGDEQSPFYWLAIVLRVAAELFLVAQVVRDVLRPEHDPVPRGDSADDDAIEAGRREADADLQLVADRGRVVLDDEQ